MDEDPSNEAFVLSLVKGYGEMKLRPWRQSQPTARRIGGPNTSLG
jgi:hypothetical protein